MPSKILFRRDTAANWASANPILALGEMGIVTDTRTFKVGDGVNQWNDLEGNWAPSEVQIAAEEAAANAAASESTATTQAGIATTQAGNAAASALTAQTYATLIMIGA